MYEVSRTDYIDWLDRKQGNGLIKIVTGVRRCGKSYLLFTLFRRHLLEKGVQDDHIVALALDDYDNRQYLDADELYKYVRSKLNDGEHYYSRTYPLWVVHSTGVCEQSTVKPECPRIGVLLNRHCPRVGDVT